MDAGAQEDAARLRWPGHRRSTRQSVEYSSQMTPLETGLAPPRPSGDLGEDAAIEHVSRVQSISHCAFRGFDDDDVRILCTRLQLRPFRVSEMIVCKGEHASWMGIVLLGDLQVKIPNSEVVFQLHRGDLLGEVRS